MVWAAPTLSVSTRITVVGLLVRSPVILQHRITGTPAASTAQAMSPASVPWSTALTAKEKMEGGLEGVCLLEGGAGRRSGKSRRRGPPTAWHRATLPLSRVSCPSLSRRTRAWREWTTTSADVRDGKTLRHVAQKERWVVHGGSPLMVVGQVGRGMAESGETDSE
jgi:hypothetical protein